MAATPLHYNIVMIAGLLLCGRYTAVIRGPGEWLFVIEHDLGNGATEHQFVLSVPN